MKPYRPNSHGAECAPRRMAIGVLIAATLLMLGSMSAAQPQATVALDIKLRTGGALTGLVVEHDERGLVVVSNRTPFVFAWAELESGSAYVAKRQLLTMQRGDKTKLTPDDHLALGLFALSMERSDFAANEFAEARRMDRSFDAATREAMSAYRRNKEAQKKKQRTPLSASPDPAADASEPVLVDTSVAAARFDLSMDTALPPEELRQRVMKAYEVFGAKVRETLGSEMILLETEHFLIWTDWEPAFRDQLTGWCESMYAALRSEFALPAGEDVFLAKCPVFCFRSKKRFAQFAKYFDGYDSVNAVGYTRSLEKSGHVHVAIVRPGHADADFDAFACTLVHEGTHAFVHRLFSNRLIPHWVNEGFAEWMADRVLGAERCHRTAKADLLARAYVRHEWPLGELLTSDGPIAIEQYAIAHSVTGYLIRESPARFTAFIRRLKQGNPQNEALAQSFEGLTSDDLASRWRASVRAGTERRHPTPQPEAAEDRHPASRP